jgi:hypothetical protein
MTKIDDNNYELWLLSYAEEKLNDKERVLVEAWLATHPIQAEELTLYMDAPQIEQNADIRYNGTIPGTTRPIWGAMLRWSAAAAVVLLLSLPAMRQQPIEQSHPMIAQTEIFETKATDIKESIDTIGPIIPTESIKSIQPSPSIAYIPKQSSDEDVHAIATAQTIPSNLTIDSFPATPNVINTTTLVAIEEHHNQTTTIENTNTLVAEETSNWGDLLLASNNSLHNELRRTTLGRLVSNRLPNNEQLLDKVVDPTNESIERLRKKINK